jgi:DNA-binding PadR family transcriptional regulator
LVSLRYAILTLLAREPLSGYDLITYFDGSVGFVWHATHPQIYRALDRLRREKLVVDKLVVQTGRPNKRVHSISAKGKRDLLAWVATPAPLQTVKDGILLRAFSYGRIDRVAAAARLREYRQLHEERLAHYRELSDLVAGSPDAAARIGSQLTLKAGMLHEESYIRWCDWASRFLAGRSAAPRRRTPRRGARRGPRRS